MNAECPIDGAKDGGNGQHRLEGIQGQRRRDRQMFLLSDSGDV